MNGIFSFISSFFAPLLPLLFKKKENVKQFEKLRFDIAAALTMYARYFHNPVDLARQADHSLPQDYKTASAELRKLGSVASALAETTPEKKLPISKADLLCVSKNLIGLSNSMCTPYNSGSSREDRAVAREYELEIRNLLRIDNSAS